MFIAMATQSISQAEYHYRIINTTNCGHSCINSINLSQAYVLKALMLKETAQNAFYIP